MGENSPDAAGDEQSLEAVQRQEEIDVQHWWGTPQRSHRRTLPRVEQTACQPRPGDATFALAKYFAKRSQRQHPTLLATCMKAHCILHATDCARAKESRAQHPRC